MTNLTLIMLRLNTYFTLLEVDAKKLHIDTGIPLRTCYRILRCESTMKLETLYLIKKAYPEISLSYLLS